MKSLEQRILEVLNQDASDKSKAHQIAILTADDIRDFMLALYRLPPSNAKRWIEKG